MKLKLIGIISTLIAILVILVSINAKGNKEDNVSVIKELNYDKAIEQGLQSNNISLNDVLYEKIIGDNKIIFFTSHEALGVAYMKKVKGGWTFSRISALYDFKSESNPPSDFMAGGTEIETPDGRTYFLAMGKIFNPKITKITLSNDSINTIIKEKYGNIFWFQLLENKDLNKDIKAYDKDGKQLN